MITLFHRPKTRSARFIFLLEELETPYEIKLVSTRTRDGGEVDSANPHPHGKVPAIMSKFMKTDVPRGTAGWVPVEEMMPVLIKTLAAGPYILGEHFSAADVLYGTTFAMFAQSPVIEKSSVIDDYVKRILARPAHARALAREGQLP
jgi:glutathione S-transferase